MKFINIFFLSFITVAGSYFFSRSIRTYALKKNLLDIPNHRSLHQVITPRGGGLAIVFLFLLGISYLYFFQSLNTSLYFVLMMGSLLIAGIGFIDDFRSLSIRLRLTAHILAAGLTLLVIGGFPTQAFLPLSWAWVGYIFSFLFITWMINLYNFMDGIDGLASSEAIFISMGSCILLFMQNQFELATIYALLCFSIIGFSFWNWAPAKLFMGDVGSGSLGYIFAVLMIASVQQTGTSIWAWIILPGVFITDATITLLRRIYFKKAWYQSHRTHAYQHLTQRWNSHKKVTLVVAGVNVYWLLPWSIAVLHYPQYGFACAVIAFSPLIIAAFLLKAGCENLK